MAAMINYSALHEGVRRAPAGTIVAVSFADGVSLELKSPEGSDAHATPDALGLEFQSFAALSEVVQAANPGTAATMAFVSGLVLSVATTRGFSAPYPPSGQQESPSPPWQQQVSQCGLSSPPGRQRASPVLSTASSVHPTVGSTNARHRPRVRSSRATAPHSEDETKKPAAPRKLHEIPRQVRMVERRVFHLHAQCFLWIASLLPWKLWKVSLRP